MSSIMRASSKALVLAGLMLAGCAGDSNDGIFTTGTLGTSQTAAAPPEARVDPACVTLASRIDGLRKEGVGDKIEKAATKKYKMTQADLGKADQLTKANAEFQLRCSTVTPSSVQASSSPVTRPPAVKAAPKAAASVTSPAPTQN